MKNKVTKETKQLMKDLRTKGISFAGIGKILMLSTSTVQYHLNPEQRKAAISRATKNPKIWIGKKDYMQKYMLNRYNTDDEFRERMRKHSRESWRKIHGKQ